MVPRVHPIYLIVLFSLALAGGCESAPLQVDPGPGEVASLKVDLDTVSVIAGEGVMVAATAVDRDGRIVPGTRLEWRSEDSAIASVDSAGRILGIQPGSTSVTVSYPTDGTIAPESIRTIVTPRLQRLELSVDTIELAGSNPCNASVLGFSYDRWGRQMVPQLVNYRMEDTTVATVRKRAGGTGGLIGATVYGHRPGESRLFAWTSFDTTSIPVYVGDVLPSHVQVRPGPSPHYFAIGDTAAVEARLIDECGGVVDSPVEVSSDRPEIASIDAQRRLTAHAAGTTYVRGTAGTLRDSALVTVNDYRLSPSDTVVAVGDTVIYRATFADSTGVFRAWYANFSVSDTAVVRLLDSGRQTEMRAVTLRPGEAIVTARVFAAARARIAVEQRE